MASAARWNYYSKIYNFFLQAADNMRHHQFDLLDQQQVWQNVPQQIYIAGAGTGLDLPYLANRLATNSQLTLVDFSSEMLARAEKLIQQRQYPWQITTKVGRAEQSGLADNSCDLVLLHLILAVTSTPQELLNEAVRVLKPNGVISLWDKFLPDGKEASLCRKGFDAVTTALGTTINLRLQELIEPLPLVIERRHFCHFGLMQQVILRKQTA
ncbi:class I SAM-dependent methyltransferase [Gallibacterium salpingitidis]|uniref:Methyltransferase n=1 Tax=Gallibacterium salpingitidis TaxID=505341 RepID=A0A1A7P0U1_9PAST|nr:class I SAM-dependent methyltransferase [Gallibacterium salpingitidis]OBW95361.1 methyltransferase [Gallibacterium salpingitidis]